MKGNLADFWLDLKCIEFHSQTDPNTHYANNVKCESTNSFSRLVPSGKGSWSLDNSNDTGWFGASFL